MSRIKKYIQKRLQNDLYKHKDTFQCKIALGSAIHIFKCSYQKKYNTPNVKICIGAIHILKSSHWCWNAF